MPSYTIQLLISSMQQQRKEVWFILTRE